MGPRKGATPTSGGTMSVEVTNSYMLPCILYLALLKPGNDSLRIRMNMVTLLKENFSDFHVETMSIRLRAANVGDRRTFLNILCSVANVWIPVIYLGNSPNFNTSGFGTSDLNVYSMFILKGFSSVNKTIKRH